VGRTGPFPESGRRAPSAKKGDFLGRRSATYDRPFDGLLRFNSCESSSMKETARMMGVSVTAAKGRLFHAKRALRKHCG